MALVFFLPPGARNITDHTLTLPPCRRRWHDRIPPAAAVNKHQTADAPRHASRETAGGTLHYLHAAAHYVTLPQHTVMCRGMLHCEYVAAHSVICCGRGMLCHIAAAHYCPSGRRCPPRRASPSSSGRRCPSRRTSLPETRVKLPPPLVDGDPVVNNTAHELLARELAADASTPIS